MTTGWLGHLPVGAKLVTMLAATVLVTTSHWPWTGVAVSIAVGCCAVSSGLRWSAVLRPVAPTLVGVGAMAAYHLIWTDATTALRVAGMLLAIAVTAAVLVACTPVEAAVDWAIGAARPFSGVLARLSLSPESLGLALGLTLAAVPALSESLQEVRAAAAARGVRSARVWLVPVVVRAVMRAQRSAEALTARGLLDSVERGTATPAEVHPAA